MVLEPKMLEIKYYYQDEFGQETETKKTYSEDVLETTVAIDLMMIDFKNHLKSCGFNDELIKEFAEIHLTQN